MLGALAGVIGVLQAVETIKEILRIGEGLSGSLLIFDALRMDFRKVKIHKDPDCRLCSNQPTIRELVTYEESCELRSGSSCET